MHFFNKENNWLIISIGYENERNPYGRDPYGSPNRGPYNQPGRNEPYGNPPRTYSG